MAGYWDGKRTYSRVLPGSEVGGDVCGARHCVIAVKMEAGMGTGERLLKNGGFQSVLGIEFPFEPRIYIPQELDFDGLLLASGTKSTLQIKCLAEFGRAQVQARKRIALEKNLRERQVMGVAVPMSSGSLR